MKKDAYYFSHDSNAQDDPKCMLLIDQLGMEGYGIFWALIEKLRSEKDYKLPITITASFARRWCTSKEKIDTVVRNFNLFTVDENNFFSERLIRSMFEKSNHGKIAANKRWNNNQLMHEHHRALLVDARGMPDDAIKVKESKVKESKVNKNKIKEKKIKKDVYEIFECFRKLYPGTKRGLETEFCNFQKKHGDWENIIPALLPALESQIAIKKQSASLGGFVPQWKNLQTYINQRCWEEEVIVIVGKNNNEEFVGENEIPF